MAQSDARFAYQAKLSRADHDLSSQFGFTCAPGMLLPIFADIATPGDSYYIKHDLSFMRTAPLIAPAMIDVKVHFESFFVPMQMIYQPIENSIFSLQEIQSSNFYVSEFKNQNLPFFKYMTFANYIGAGSGRTDPSRMNVYRLFDMLDMPVDDIPGRVASTSDYGSTFPWQLAAYQAIFQYWYRLDDKETFDHRSFNLDSEYQVNSLGIPANRIEEMAKLRFRPWNFDYFTGSYRSPIISNEGTLGVFSGSLSVLTSGRSVPRTNGGLTSPDNNNVFNYSADITNTYDASNIRQQVNTAAIRQLFAAEKLAMITGRTRKNYDSQVLAHYGVNVPHDPKHDLSLIGRDSFDLRIGEVTSLASTETAPLGELAGKGWAYGSSEKQHKFTAPCHGVVMTLFSVEPKLRYEETANRLNFITNAVELPTPEFDRLGNMPLYKKEIVQYSGAQSASNPTPWNTIVAWKERYYANKRRYNRVSSAFRHPGRDYNNYSGYFIHSCVFGLSPEHQSDGSNLNAYYINPFAMNDLMLVSYTDIWQDGSETAGQTGENWDDHPTLIFKRDPFICDTYLKVKKVSWMSKDGEPIYNV